MKNGNAFLTFFLTLAFSTSLMACGLFRPADSEGYSGELSEEENQLLDQVIEQRVESKKDEKPDNGADDDCEKWGDDSATAVVKYSLYSDYEDKENYEMAYPFWTWLYSNAPCVNENLYINGAKILKYKIEEAKEAAEKAENEEDEKKKEAIADAYVDTLMMMYDQRVNYFGKEGYVLGRKGMDLLKTRSKDYEKAYDILKKSVEIEGKEAQSYVVYYYVYSSVLKLKYEKHDVAQLLEDYQNAMEIIKANEEEKGWAKIKDLVNDRVAPILSCDDLVGVYKEKYEDSKDDEASLKDMQKLLDSKGCTGDEFYFTLSEKIFELDPSAESAFGIARGFEAKGNNSKALEYYKRAVELDDTKADYHLQLAQAYKATGSYAAAQNHAKRAVSINSGLGEAYILLGDIYVSGAGQCGEGFDRQAVYWAAVDQYKKAQSDPDVASKAAGRVATYQKAFPTKEKIFFNNLEIGQAYEIKCWINESTTVRASSE